MGGSLSVDKREGRRLSSQPFAQAIEKCRAAEPTLAVPTDIHAPPLAIAPGTVSVVVRVRPLFPHEAEKREFGVISCGGGNVAVHETSLPRGVGFDGALETHRFQAQHVFDASCGNDDVFAHSVAPLVDFALGGGQGTAFMFGQTGSGKTYTMGAMYERAAGRCFDAAGGGDGVARVSFVELVGDSARDLLRAGEDGGPAAVKLLTDAEGCVQLANALELEVSSAEQLTGAIAGAIQLRAQAATGIHDHSSRSHAVCRIQLGDASGVLTLVDLAGSERNAATLHNNDAKLIRQAAQINTSLMALKDCVRARDRGEYPNFRASKLTQLLKSSFEHPNAALVCVTTISPAAGDTEYSLSSLHHAVLMRDESGERSEGDPADATAGVKKNEVILVTIDAASLAAAMGGAAPPEPEPEIEPEPGADSMTREEARVRLHKVYTEHLPTKLHVIDGLLEKYASNLSDIVRKVEEKYNTPPTSAADLMKQNKRMKGARALVQQKSVIAKSWSLWYDDMRAGIPCKLWPLPGEAVPPATVDLPSGGGNVRHEPGGAKEWLGNSWTAWREEPPAWFTPTWQHAIPAHFLPAGVELDDITDEVEAPAVEAHVFGGPVGVVVWAEPVNEWVREQGWSSEHYRVAPSALQSCPAGMVTLDCDCMAEDVEEDERLRLSRVVEVDEQTGAVVTVLAAKLRE